MVAGQQLVNAQVLVGKNDRILLSHSVGKRSPEDPRPVDPETMFCIGSCSKPFASACLLTLVDEGKLTLEQTVDVWLPAFKQGKIKGGGVLERAPTLRELLCHRAGVYSQKVGITKRQADLIYVHDHTLEFAVEGIAKEAFLSPPGTTFAYSGAGYCVLGRAVEVAVGSSFDDCLQEKISRPLGLRHTTYFPNQVSKNIAAGGIRKSGRQQSNGKTPHLAQPHRMQLIGGSLYSTASDMGTFAAMIANQGRHQDHTVLSRQGWHQLLKRQAPDQDYGLGWRQERVQGDVVELSHSGSLASSRALIKIHLPSRSYVVLVYSLAAPTEASRVSPRLKQTAIAVLNGLAGSD